MQADLRGRFTWLFLLAPLLLWGTSAVHADEEAKKKAELLLRMQTKRAIHKGAKWMRPLEKPPFAALCANVGEGFWVGFALGGLKCDIEGRLLREDGSVIEGLYAVGACAANIAQDGTGYSSGTCIGESTYFGRRAGRSAAAD